jgi:hypothetical protein
VPCVYDSLGPLSEGMVSTDFSQTKINTPIVHHLSPIGYLNIMGKKHIKQQFYIAHQFIDGKALVSLDGRKFGFIDKDCKAVSPFSFENRVAFGSELAEVKVNGKWGFIDTQFNFVIDPTFEEAGTFISGLARVKKNKKWGFIDKLGNTLIHPVYDDAMDFSDGLAAVKRGEKWGFIDTENNLRISYSFTDVLNFSQGLAGVKFPKLFGIFNQKYGYINKENDVVVEAKFDRVYEFNRNLAKVYRSNKVGFIDINGNEIIKTIYDSVRGEFDDSIIEVTLNGNHGYVGEDGTQYWED